MLLFASLAGTLAERKRARKRPIAVDPAPQRAAGGQESGMVRRRDRTRLGREL